GMSRGHVLAGWHQTDYVDGWLELCDGPHDSKRRRGSRHIVFHSFHAVGRFDGNASGIKCDALAYDGDEVRLFGCCGRRIPDVPQHNKLTGLIRAAGDAQQGAHSELFHLWLVQDFYGQPELLSSLTGPVREFGWGENAARFV